MGCSADAILLGLRLVEQGHLSPREAAEHLRAVIAGDVPDHLVALEERILTRRPELSARTVQNCGEAPYVPVDCPGCKARFRVLPDQVGPSAYCPLCGEAIMKANGLAFLGDDPMSGLRAAEAPAHYAAAAAPERFAHFELHGLLGRGGTGRIYRARNLRSGQTVALKLLHFQPLEPAADSLRRLRQEAHAAAAVEHENVVRVFDLGVAEGLAFIEMQLVEGPSLRERMRRDGPMPPEQACLLCRQVLAGLAQVHRHGIVHGDIKPGNILLRGDGVPLLTDFGIARLLEETTSETPGSKVVGSPHFMAPEQWRGERLTLATDLYAMGLVLYSALLARLPYEGQSRVALMYKHLHEPLLDPQEYYPEIPRYLAEVIVRATEKPVAERFGNAEEFAGALELFLGGSVL